MVLRQIIPWMCGLAAVLTPHCFLPAVAWAAPDVPNAPLLTPPPFNASSPAFQVDHHPPLEAHAGIRAGMRILDDPRAPNGMEKLGAEGLAELVVSGQVNPTLSWQLGFFGTFGTGLLTPDHRISLLDLIAKFEPSPYFNVWIGRLPIPSDRASLDQFSTALVWTPPGTYSSFSPSVGFRRGTDHRGSGAVLWGQTGWLSYHVGMFDPGALDTSQLFSGRIELQFLNKESGFFRTNGYDRGNNMLSVALSGQRQANGSQGILGVDDFHTFGGDLLLELSSPSAGAFDLELSLSKIWGLNEMIDTQFCALASYLLPQELSLGRFQPLLRFQQAGAKDGTNLMLFDGQLGYVLKGPRARILVLYQYGKLPEGRRNLILLGLQLATR